MMKLNTHNALMSLVSGTSLLVISLAANAAPPAAKPDAAKPPVTTIAKKVAPSPKTGIASVHKASSKAKKHVKHTRRVKHISAKRHTKANVKAHTKKG